MKKKTVDCKSLGIPLREDIASQVDTLVNKLPMECRSLRRKGSLPDTSELVKGERADISMISVESVDNQGEVVLAKGMDVEIFQRNPIVTFAHKYDELPVGRAAWIKKVQGGIRAKTMYTDATETSRAVWQMTQEGILKGKSIGFLPMKMRAATNEEIKSNPTWKNAGAVIETAMLLEYAVAPLPANQHALVEAVSKGRADRKTLARLGFKVPPKMSQQELAELISKIFCEEAKKLTPEKIMSRWIDTFKA